MKYIKKFNEDKVDFYTQISKGLYFEKNRYSIYRETNNLIRLNQNEVDSIGALCDSHGRGRWVCEFNFNSQARLDICKTDDEWYWVKIFKVNATYYKCDQI